MSKSVTIISVTFNSAAYFARWVDAVAAQTYHDFDVIVVDNASEADQQPKSSILKSEWRIIQNASNVGFAAANNQAVDLVSTPFVVFLNPDAFPESDWLENLVRAAEQMPRIAAFGSTQLVDGDPVRLDGAGDVWHAAGIPYRGGFQHTVEPPYPDGSCFAPCAAASLWRREQFVALGGFEASYFAYCEDVDLGFRLRLLGGASWQVGSAIVHHVGSGVTGRRSNFTVRLGTRNRLWTFVRCVPSWLFLATLPIHILATGILWLKALKDGVGNAFLSGLWEGLRGLAPVLKMRRTIQSQRIAPTDQIAKAMSWSPISLFRRSVVLLDQN
jgi:N-acetylglucosaminyl-diphospho-decaprenol L-rhamnosyltransferase